MDMLGPFPKSNQGNKYIMVMVDQFTKWVEIHALPDITAIQTVRCAVDQFFSRFGTPLEIHTDQGKNFDGSVMHALCELYRITKTRTTPYHPSSNGQVERYNRLLLQMIRCYITQNSRDWDEDLQLLAGAIRGMKHRSIGYSANEMMLGTDVYTPTNIIFQTPGDETEEEPATYVEKLRRTLQKAHQVAASHLKTQLGYRKRYGNLRLCEKTYDVGDFVYRLNQATKTGQSRKLKPVWKGPLVVIKVLSPVLFRVRDRKKEHVLHHDKLKPCTDRHIPMWLRRLRHQVLSLDVTLTDEEGALDETVTKATERTGLPEVAQNPKKIKLSVSKPEWGQMGLMFQRMSPLPWIQ